MNQDIKEIIDYLSSVSTDPFPRYLLKTEILGRKPDAIDLDEIHNSKWYKQLETEQWEDGSWGRFHTSDSKAKNKQTFQTTESALRRVREFNLPKEDPMISKCLGILEKYVSGEETWTDNIEKQNDGEKSHLLCRPYMSAAVINTFDPNNQLIKPLRDKALESLKKAFVSGSYDEKLWEKEYNEYRVPSIIGTGMYGIKLFSNMKCMDDKLQKQYLDYAWNKKTGIYYVSSIAVAERKYLEDRQFSEWLSNLELLNGFSLFPEFMNVDIYSHLISEVRRLLNGDIIMHKSCKTRYSESWRDIKDSTNLSKMLREY